MKNSVEWISNMLTAVASYMAGIPCFGDYYQVPLPTALREKKQLDN